MLYDRFIYTCTLLCIVISLVTHTEQCCPHYHDQLPETVVQSIAGIAQGLVTIAASENPYDKELLAEQGHALIAYLSQIALIALTRTRNKNANIPTADEITAAFTLALSHTILLQGTQYNHTQAAP